MVERPEHSFEEYGLTRPEYISAMVHLYRGEMHRALTWRQRLDTTTNWAVLLTGAMLSFLFSKEEHHHVVALLGVTLVFCMLCYEARRFRYFGVWRSRVRKLEENFYVPLLRRELTSPVQNWGFIVAEDLLTPRFKMSFLAAVRARLIRNYIPLFAVLYGAWLLKLSLHGERTEGGGAPTFGEMLGHTGVGPVPAWLIDTVALGFALFLIGVALFARPRWEADSPWWSTRSDESGDEVS